MSEASAYCRTEKCLWLFCGGTGGAASFSLPRRNSRKIKRGQNALRRLCPLSDHEVPALLPPVLPGLPDAKRDQVIPKSFSASMAAFCSASRLEEPDPCPMMLLFRRASTVKVLACAGPVSDTVT